MQSNFDAVWCRGTVMEKIFEPLVERIKVNNCQFLEGQKVTDFLVNEETGCISEVVCGKERFVADAVVLAVGIPRLQQMIRGSGWAFFDLNAIYDEFNDNSVTVEEANFAFVTGLEAANRVVNYLEEGSFAKIIPVEEDEPHGQEDHGRQNLYLSTVEDLLISMDGRSTIPSETRQDGIVIRTPQATVSLEDRLTAQEVQMTEVLEYYGTRAPRFQKWLHHLRLSHQSDNDFTRCYMREMIDRDSRVARGRPGRVLEQ
ncbi:hypothetical protein Sjap_017396 [Stephania japonica]|uniref:FAD/NAD(P)-binding domain-containing protein n=1 Tax=Stephania japonica TaxID=461633 RepID=A0AAP0I666_9MAGN